MWFSGKKKKEWTSSSKATEATVQEGTCNYDLTGRDGGDTGDGAGADGGRDSVASGGNFCVVEDMFPWSHAVQLLWNTTIRHVLSLHGTDVEARAGLLLTKPELQI